MSHFNYLLHLIAGKRIKSRSFEYELFTYAVFFTVFMVVLLDIPSELFEHDLDIYHLAVSGIYGGFAALSWVMARYFNVFFIKSYVIIGFMITVYSWILDGGVISNNFIYILKDLTISILLIRSKGRIIIPLIIMLITMGLVILDPYIAPQSYNLLSQYWLSYLLDDGIIMILFFIIIGVTVKASDLERKELIRKIQALQSSAEIDTLTQIPNRKSFLNDINRYHDEYMSEKSKKYYSISLLDIDHFKSINDTFGHLIGDTTLRVIAEMLDNVSKKYRSRAYRLSGEEFVIIFNQIHLTEAQMYSDELRELISKSNIVENRVVTASFGVTEVRASDSIEVLIERADQAMYTAKRTGRNKCEMVL